MVMFQPYAYVTPFTRILFQILRRRFFTLIQGISTATYLTLPRLPRRPIGPEPFQFNFMVPQRGLEPLTTRTLFENKIAVRIKYLIRLLFVLYQTELLRQNQDTFSNLSVPKTDVIIRLLEVSYKLFIH